MKLEEVILRDDRASQPLATAVFNGTLYCVTDEGDIIERSNGTTWESYSPADSSLTLAASRLAGRGSAAGSGSPVEITLGTNLSMSGTTLNASGGAGGDVLVARLDITDAEIRSLNTVPLDIVTAPGSGIVIVPTRAIYKGIRSGTAFSADATPRIQWAGIATDLLNNPSSFIWNSAVAATLYRLVTSAAFSGSTSDDPTNKALQLTSSANMTLGTGCSLHVIVEYYLADFN